MVTRAIRPPSVIDHPCVGPREDQRGRPLAHRAVVEVEARDRVVGAGFLGLLLDAHRPAPGVELHHPVGRRVLHVVGEDGGALAIGGQGGADLEEVKRETVSPSKLAVQMLVPSKAKWTGS